MCPRKQRTRARERGDTLRDFCAFHEPRRSDRYGSAHVIVPQTINTSKCVQPSSRRCVRTSLCPRFRPLLARWTRYVLPASYVRTRVLEIRVQLWVTPWNRGLCSTNFILDFRNKPNLPAPRHRQWCSLTVELGLPQLSLFPHVDELVLAVGVARSVLHKLQDLSQLLDGHLSRQDGPREKRHLVVGTTRLKRNEIKKRNGCLCHYELQTFKTHKQVHCDRRRLSEEGRRGGMGKTSAVGLFPPAVACTSRCRRGDSSIK